MNTDKTNPKNCFWFYPCLSVFIRGHLFAFLRGKQPIAWDGGYNSN
jgi:hypothetical protein